MTNVNKEDFNSIESEAFAEHEAEKVRKAEQKEIEEQKELTSYREKEQQKRIEENKKLSKHLYEIAKCIPSNYSHSVEEESFSIIISGIDTKYLYHMSDEYGRGSGFFSKPTGRKRFVINTREGRKNFPPKKDGTFNYKEIALIMINYVDRQFAQARIQDQKKKNQADVAKLVEEVFPNDKHGYQSVMTSSAVEDKPVFFKLEISQAMTVDQARNIAKLLRENGVKIHYAD